MHIHCLGLNHRTADVSLRERLAFTEEGIKTALARLGSAVSQPDAITEMVILSTCNRVELYSLSADPNFEALEAFLAEAQGVPVEAFHEHVYRRLDQEAVEHLFRVAAGLDSLVLGEPQILGQVLAAFELARSQGATGLVLSRLFQAALHTGKRARSETTISHNPSSISSIAIHLAEQSVPNLASAQIVVLGAGEMAELAVEALRKRGANHIQVVNRTLEHARQLAGRWNAEAYTFESLPELLAAADILLASTSAPHTLIDAAAVEQAMRGRPDRPLVMIDIAVPRDVDDEAGKVFGVHLYDIDALHHSLEASLARRASEVPRVEAILEEEVQMYLGYLQTLDVVPLIAEMHQQAEMIRQAELEKTLRRMPGLTPEERQRLEALTQALVKKLLHEPTNCLRSEAGSPYSARYAAAARVLFGLDSRSARQAQRSYPQARTGD